MNDGMEEHLQRALTACGVSADVFSRAGNQYARRGIAAGQARAAVWLWLREHPEPGGSVMSYPRIAAATGASSPATVFRACEQSRRM